MALHFSAYKRPVGISAKQLIRIPVKRLHSVLIYADAAINIGTGGVSSDSGLPISAGGSFTLSYQDFNMSEVQPGDMLVIDAVAAVATDANIVLITS